MVVARGFSGAGRRDAPGVVPVGGRALRDLSCALDQQLLLGPVAVAAALASQKAALDACGKDGQAFRVAFRWTDPPTVTVEASSAPPAANACVQKALQSVAPPVSGTCAIVVLTGPTEAAEAARARLAPK